MKKLYWRWFFILYLERYTTKRTKQSKVQLHSMVTDPLVSCPLHPNGQTFILNNRVNYYDCIIRCRRSLEHLNSFWETEMTKTLEDNRSDDKFHGSTQNYVELTHNSGNPTPTEWSETLKREREKKKSIHCTVWKSQWNINWKHGKETCYIKDILVQTR